MTESLDSRLERLAAEADRAELPSAATVRRRGENRRRNHRLAVALGSFVLLAAVTTPVAIVLAGASTQPSPTTRNPTTAISTPGASSTTLPSSTATNTVSLPRADLYNQLAVVQGQLLLSGETAATAAAKTPTCVSAHIDPRTLAIGAEKNANCNDPAVQGETVEAVDAAIPGSNNATVSIAHWDARTGSTTVGPVVMTYGNYSDTRPVTAYGGGWFWVYDNSTIVSGSETVDASHPGTAELLQISTSGQIVDTVPMPVLYRPLMAADNNGLWIGNSVEGGECSGCSPPGALYYVAPGSNQAVAAIPDSTLVVCWLLGNDEHLWVGTGDESTGCTHETIRRLDGTDFQPVFLVPDQGYDPNTVIGDEADGLWTMQWTHRPTGGSSTLSPQEIVGINPDSGAEKVVATLPALVVPLTGEYSGLVEGQAAVFDGSLYLLEPPYQEDGYLGYSTLVRVPLP